MSLYQVADRVAAMLADEARSQGVGIAIEGDTDVSLRADRVQVEQVLVNLIRNGIGAAAKSEARAKRVVVRVRQSTGMAQVDVEDNGRGVPASIAERLFEPFVTDKSCGMGLGLLLSRQIIECHGGKLWWERLDGGGTRFTFRIPRERA